MKITMIIHSTYEKIRSSKLWPLITKIAKCFVELMMDQKA